MSKKADPIIHHAMGSDYKLSNGTCRYWESSPVGLTAYTVLVFKKNGKYNEIFNKA